MSKFLDLFQKNSSLNPPIWFMRQAGRYLPEYRDVRKEFKTFLDLCYTPDFAAKVTLQPLQRFDFDVAILFSDILVIPDALGQKVVFEETKGPHLESLSLKSYQKSLSIDRFFEKTSPVYETTSLVKSQLSSSKALMGFAGAPWTLALYMLEGKGSKDFAKAKTEAFQDEDQFSSFLDFLSDAVSKHLIEQVKAGAQTLQIFDSWAGLCPSTHFERWVIEPTQKIIQDVKKVFPSVPIVGFPKGVGAHLLDYGVKSGVSALSLDSCVPLSWAVEKIPHSLVLQGNLDPFLLVSGGEPLKRAIQSIHTHMKGRSYVFNLGHGILPQTPISHVEACIEWVRELR